MLFVKLSCVMGAWGFILLVYFCVSLKVSMNTVKMPQQMNVPSLSPLS